MKKTLCKISSGSQEFEWYLVVNENNNLILSQVNEDPNFNGDNVCIVYNYNGNSMNELFDILANTEHPKNVNKDSEAGVYMLLSGAMFKCFKDLLEKGLKIPQHQMPNIPNNNGPQMHNIVQVFNPHNQHHHNQHNNPSVLMDENTLFMAMNTIKSTKIQISLLHNVIDTTIAQLKITQNMLVKQHTITVNKILLNSPLQITIQP